MAAIGIDVGTQYCRVAVWQDSHPVIIPDEEGNRNIPSYISFGKDGRLFGSIARSRQTADITNTVYGVKRFLGRTFADPHVQELARKARFSCINRGGMPHFQVERLGKQESFTAEELLAMQLSKLKKLAQGFVKGEIGKAVISIPPGSSSIQRQALKDACEIAGIPDPILLSETSAATIYYTFYSHAREKLDESQPKTILMVDIGAGTTGVAITTIEAGIMEVKAIESDYRLGGDDFDQLFVSYIANAIQITQKIDLSRQPRAMARLTTACEKAKRALSSAQKAQIDLEGVSENLNISTMLVTRDEFERTCSNLCRAITDLVRKVLSRVRSSNLEREVEEIVLVGGATRIPCVVASILKPFGPSHPTPVTIRNLDEAVAYGSAINAAIHAGRSEQLLESMLLLDVLNLSLSIAVIPNADPASNEPEYLPADGGSPHESILRTVVKRNTIIPTKKSEGFSTASNDQTTAHIQVYEGDHEDPSKNTFLGSFELHGIPKPPSRDKFARVEVEFDLNADASITVRATHKEYGYATRSLVIRVGRLSQQSKRMMKERAKTLDEWDRAYEERTQRRNNLEEYCYSFKEAVEGLGRGVDECLRWLEYTDSKPVSESEFSHQEQQLVALAQRVLPPGYTVVRESANNNSTMPGPK